MLKMDEDIIEKPICKVLYRQSSLETRLSPVNLAEEYNSEDEEECKSLNPKIIDVVPKLPQTVVNDKFDSEKDRKNIEAEMENIIIDSVVKKLVNKDATNLYKPKPILQPRTSSLKEKPESYLNISKVVSPTAVNKHELCVNQNLKEHFKQELIQKLGKPDDTEGMSKVINEDREVDFRRKNYLNEVENNELCIGLLRALIPPKKTSIAVEETVGAPDKKEEMATLRPKSPRPVAVSGQKEESIWDKIGTLGRKKRIKEVQEVQNEGKIAIDSPGLATIPITPDDYNLDDNEERCMIDPRAHEDPKFIELLNVLKEWINDELASQRIIVQDIAEDLYDGQVLQKLLEKLTGDKLDVPEVTQSEEGQKQKLTVVLDHFNQILGIQRSDNKWNVEAIHSKNIVSIVHLLVALARHFRPPVRLPEYVSVDVVFVQKVKGQLFHKTVREHLTKTYDDVGMRCERDAFDTLFDHAPDKLQVVKKSLVTFVNKHLSKMNFEVTEIESQFHDGVYLIMLMGLLEGFFVPHYVFHLTPNEFEQKVQNVNFAFELMEEVGLQKPKARPEDVVNMDLKSTLRVLYILFLKYRTVL